MVTFKKIVIIMFVLVFVTGCVTNKAYLNQTQVIENINEDIEIKEKGTVVVLATGGTIAGAGESGKETNYTSGTLLVDNLIDSVEGLSELANIEAIQICNINSDDINIDIWCELAKTIDNLALNDNVDGFVITHGTDTMEETAYFLNLVLKTDKPVILTGSMRPATSLSPDGPMNLYQAVSLASQESAKGYGVMCVFSGHIYSARYMTKNSTYNLEAFGAGELGAMGIVRNSEIFMYDKPIKKHTIQTEFTVEDIIKKPKVNVMYFAAEADPQILKYAAQKSDGLVIAGAGAGEFSKEYAEVINNLDIPVVITSRINDGLITQDSVLCPNTIAANNLSPQKAAVLLRLALEKTSDFKELLRIFNTY